MGAFTFPRLPISPALISLAVFVSPGISQASAANPNVTGNPSTAKTVISPQPLEQLNTLIDKEDMPSPSSSVCETARLIDRFAAAEDAQNQAAGNKPNYSGMYFGIVGDGIAQNATKAYLGDLPSDSPVRAIFSNAAIATERLAGTVARLEDLQGKPHADLTPLFRARAQSDQAGEQKRQIANRLVDWLRKTCRASSPAR